MNNKLLTPQFLSLVACLGLAFAPVGCGKDEPIADEGSDTSGDGDGDPTGDGDGDPTDPGDGDGDPTAPGDGDGDPTSPGDGDGEPMGELGNGEVCTADSECLSGQCYIIPILSGQCGECNHDDDCPDGGCTAPNPFENNGSTCNMGEIGGGCESSDVCSGDLTCGNVLSLLAGLITIDTCGECASDMECAGQICAPVVDVMGFSGINTCIDANTLAQDSFCNLEGNGDEACASGICSVVDIMGLAEIGSCGECNIDDDCDAGMTCQGGGFDLGAGALSGSLCI